MMKVNALHSKSMTVNNTIIKTPEVFTWELGRHQWGHHDTVGPLGGVKQMSMGVMVFLQFLLT